jgi:hypothetical protein
MFSTYTRLNADRPKVSLKIGDTNQVFEIYNKSIKAYRRDENSSYLFWQYENDIEKIEDALLFDYDKNGDEDLIVLLWKRGDYNEPRNYLKPIRGEKELSQHIYIFHLAPYPKLRWGGSAMQKPIKNLSICKDNIKKLCAKQAEYETFPKTHKDIEIDWKGWWWEVIEIPNHAR